MATLATVVGAAMALTLFVMLADLVLIQYGRGVARTAVDEAARIGSAAGGDAVVCERALDAVLDDLLGGPYGTGLTGSCRVDGIVVEARVDGVLRPVSPVIPDVAVEAESWAVFDVP